MISAILLISALADAQPPPWTQQSVRDFSGGINTSNPALYIEQNESPNLLNVDLDEKSGALLRRRGSLLCGSIPSNNAITNMVEFFDSSGERALVLTDNANIYETLDCQTFTTVKTGLSATIVPQFKMARDKLWITQKSTHPATWDGSVYTQVLSTNSPRPDLAQFIEFDEERFWLCRSTHTGESACQFSSLVDSLGNALNPETSTNAWLATNVIQVNRDDGDFLFGLKSFNGELLFFKEKSTWKRVGSDEFTFGVVKVCDVGTRFSNAVEESDGILYFPGPDGVYAYAGGACERISDKWRSEFSNLAQPNVLEAFKLWTAAGDFDDGTLNQVSTGTVAGSITRDTITGVASTNTVLNASFENGDFDNWSKTVPSCSGDLSCTLGTDTGLVFLGSDAARFRLAYTCPSGSCILAAGERGPYTLKSDTFTYLGGPVEIYWASTRDADANNPSNDWTIALADPSDNIKYTLKSIAAGEFSSSYLRSSGTPTGIVFGDTVRWYITGRFHWSAGWGINGGTTESINFYVDASSSTGLRSSGTWTSDTFQATSLSSWTVFDVDQTLNGETVDWQIRCAVAEAYISTQPHTTITPGAMIPCTQSQAFAQVLSTFTAYDTTKQGARVDSVRLNYTRGGSPTQRLFAARQPKDNKIWLLAASSASTTNDQVWLKSRGKNAWWKYDLDLSSLARWNDTLYGGSSTDGKIYRLNYGDSDNGSAINAYWESKDFVFGQPGMYHTLREIDLDYHRTGNPYNIVLSYSRNEGGSWSSYNIAMNQSDITGATTGRYRKQTFPQSIGAQHRFRVSLNGVDMPFTVYGLDFYASPYERRMP